jgi:hypothetical protein
MKRLPFVCLVVATLASMTANALSAQDRRIVHFGLMGGATNPVGDIGTLARHDWSAGALVSIGAPSSPISFRIDGQWQQLAGLQPRFSPYTLCVACAGSVQPNKQDYRVIDLTSNVIYNFEPTATASFYLIGGIGAYNERQTDRENGATESLTRFGVNGGVGVKLRLGRFQPFVEARYHDIMGGHSFGYGVNYPPSRSFQFVPINVGIVF